MKAKQNPNLITALYERLSRMTSWLARATASRTRRNFWKTTPPSGASPTSVTSPMTAILAPTSTGQASGP